MTGLDWEQLGRLYGVIAVEGALLGTSVAYAVYLYSDRRAAGDPQALAPVYTAIGTLFTVAAHLALMLILWPLDPLQVTALLLAQFAISGTPPLVGRLLERRKNASEARRDAELTKARLMGEQDALRKMSHD